MGLLYAAYALATRSKWPYENPVSTKNWLEPEAAYDSLKPALGIFPIPQMNQKWQSKVLFEGVSHARFIAPPCP